MQKSQHCCVFFYLMIRAYNFYRPILDCVKYLKYDFCFIYTMSHNFWSICACRLQTILYKLIPMIRICQPLWLLKVKILSFKVELHWCACDRHFLLCCPPYSGDTTAYCDAAIRLSVRTSVCQSVPFSASVPFARWRYVRFAASNTFDRGLYHKYICSHVQMLSGGISLRWLLLYTVSSLDLLSAV